MWWLIGILALFFGGMTIYGGYLSKREAGNLDGNDAKGEKKKDGFFSRFKARREKNKKYKITHRPGQEENNVSSQETEIAPNDFGNDLISQVRRNIDHDNQTTQSVEAPRDNVLKDSSSLVGEDGLLYSYCMENANKLYTHRIKSLGSSIKYIREHPEFSKKLVDKVNSLPAEHYETALDATISEIKNNPKNEELRAVRDTLLAVIYTTGVNRDRDSFLKRERAFDDKMDFVDQIKDDRLREKFRTIVTTSKGNTEELRERAQQTDVEPIIIGTLGKSEAIKKFNEVALDASREKTRRKAA